MHYGSNKAEPTSTSRNRETTHRSIDRSIDRENISTASPPLRDKYLTSMRYVRLSLSLFLSVERGSKKDG